MRAQPPIAVPSVMQLQGLAERIRAELAKAGHDPDAHVAVTGGGVLLHKIRGVISDNCGPAKAARRIMSTKVKESREAHFSAASWRSSIG